MLLYLKNKNFLLVRKILFPLLFFTTACQLDQSLDKIRNTLFESEENQKFVIKEEKKKENKIKENKQKDEQLFTPDKIEDDKRILDFFTGFFGPGDDSEQVKLDKLNKEPESKEKLPQNFVENSKVEDETNRDNFEKKSIEKEKIILKKPEIKSEDTEVRPIDQSSFEEKEDSLSYEKESNIQNNTITENYVDQKKENEIKVEVEKNETEKIDEKSFAFFDLQRSKKEAEKKVKIKNNYVGLLLPLTGDKRSAGSLVLNTFRYTLVKKPMDIVFKIYDTKGTAEGAIEAAIKGKNDNVEVFVGPIFSYETKALKQNFYNDNSIVFFSLSPDLSNISDNIIVSGQNSEDQIACIVTDLKIRNVNDLLLIHHNDKYGEIIKQSVQEKVNAYSLQNINLSFMEIDKNKDLNKEIKSISQFEKRKNILKTKKNQISNDKNISKDEKKRILKKLDRQLTIDSPFDAIIVASEGDKLLEILSHLAFYDISANNTFVYGTSLWEDTLRTDPVFENTFFVTNLKKRSDSFIKNYQDVFSKTPTSVNFHLFDLIDFVNEFKLYEEYPENKIHIGKFTNSQVKSGSLRRETYIKKNKGKNRIEDVISCQLDTI